MHVRRNVFALHSDGPEISALRAGVRAMKDMPANDPRSWAYQAAIHGSEQPLGFEPATISLRREAKSSRWTQKEGSFSASILSALARNCGDVFGDHAASVVKGVGC